MNRPATAREEVIPPFRVDLTGAEIENALHRIAGVLRSGRLILGPVAEELEKRFAEFVNVEHAVSVNSGSTALEVIYRHIGVQGREVLVPTNTNFATAAAVIYAGGRPVFFDGGLYPDVDDIARRITPKTAAVVVVHIGGYVSPRMRELRQLCDSARIPLIEDAAHAHGATLGGRAAGSFGYAAAFSFFVTKVITTGEGGMIVTRDGELAASARSFRDQGKDATGLRHVRMGNSWRMTETGAAIGLAMLDKLAADTACRQRMMERYATELAGCKALAFPAPVGDMRPSGYKSIALLAAGGLRALFGKLLAEHNVEMARPVYEVPLHRQPVFQDYVAPPYPDADEFCDRHVCLPLWRHLTFEQQTRVIAAVRKSCEAMGRRA